MENMEKITLYDENNQPIEYELIDIFEFKNNVYGCFAPLLGDASNGMEESLEVAVLKLVGEDDDEHYEEIEDSSEEKAVFNEFVKRQEECEE